MLSLTDEFTVVRQFQRSNDRKNNAVRRQHVDLARDLGFVKSRLVDDLIGLQISIHASVDQNASAALVGHLDRNDIDSRHRETDQEDRIPGSATLGATSQECPRCQSWSARRLRGHIPLRTHSDLPTEEEDRDFWRPLRCIHSKARQSTAEIAKTFRQCRPALHADVGCESLAYQVNNSNPGIFTGEDASSTLMVNVSNPRRFSMRSETRHKCR